MKSTFAVFALLLMMGCGKKPELGLPKCDPPNVRTVTHDSVTCSLPTIGPTTADPHGDQEFVPGSKQDEAALRWDEASLNVAGTWTAQQGTVDPPFQLTGKVMYHGKVVSAQPDPVDVPAISEESSNQCADFLPNGTLQSSPCVRHTCADKSRILLTAEDGKKWCHKVQP